MKKDGDVKMIQENRMFWMCLGVGWVSTACAVSVAIYITKDAAPLFALIIPAIVGVFPFERNIP
jgi:hypothetical protein